MASSFLAAVALVFALLLAVAGMWGWLAGLAAVAGMYAGMYVFLRVVNLAVNV